jgi:hypothetical protein
VVGSGTRFEIGANDAGLSTVTRTTQLLFAGWIGRLVERMLGEEEEKEMMMMMMMMLL